VKQRIKTFLASGLLALALIGIAAAGPLEDMIRETLQKAEQGDAFYQSLAASLYERGQGVPQDYAQAVAWWRKAADQGLADAQVSLGWMYADGKGVPKDYAIAYMWFNLAAAHGKDPSHAVPLAVRSREQMAGMMTPDQIAEGQRLAREWVAKK
jgi:uncharacterized protein